MSTICAGVNILMPLNNDVNNEVHGDTSVGWGCDTGLCCYNNDCETDEFCFGGENYTTIASWTIYCTCGSSLMVNAKWHGTCKKKVANNEYCGFDDDSVCQSDHCVCHAYDVDFMTPAIYGTPEKKPYDSCWCRGEDGFPKGHSCSVTEDCDMSNNLYCAGATSVSAGKCSPCPSYCADQRESCSACSSSPNTLQCGPLSHWDNSVCFLNNLGGASAVFGYLSNYIDCFGEQHLSECIMTSYENNKEEIKKCLGGEDCTIKIGDGCFSFNKNYSGKHTLYNSLLGMEEEQVAKLSQEQWREISNRRWDHKFVFSEEDNMDYDDVTISREESFLELNDDDCNPSFFSKIASDGTITLSGGLVFEINPRTAKVVVNYNIDLDIQASISIIGGIDENTGHCSKEIGLADNQNMYSQVFMLGSFPVAIQLDFQPYAWVKLDLTGSVKGQIDVTKKVNVQGSISFDVMLKTINMPDPTVTEGDFSITPHLTGDASLNFVARVGPKLTISINTIPTELDLAAAAHLDMKLTLRTEENRHYCLAGSARMAASIDAKVSVVFLPNPVDALYATCLQSAKFAGAATCLGRAIIGQSGTQEENPLKEICEKFKKQMDIVTDASSCVLKFLTAGTDWIVMPLAELTIGGKWCSDSATSTFEVSRHSYVGVGATPKCS